LMAATKSQGKAFTLFTAGLTAACAGIAYSASGSGKAAFVLGAIAVIASFGMFLKLATRRHEGDGVSPGFGRLGSGSLWIAYYGQCVRKDGDFANRFRNNTRGCSICTAHRGKQERDLEGLMFQSVSPGDDQPTWS
jgi:hypothetical protein